MIKTTQTHMHKGVGIHTHIFVYIHTRRMCREEARMAEELSHVKTVTEGPESRLEIGGGGIRHSELKRCP